MPLNYTAAPSSRITKASKRSPLQRRNATSPFSSHPRRKPTPSTSRSKSQYDDRDTDDRLPDSLIHVPLPLVSSALTRPTTVVQAIAYIRTNTFSPVPERAPGMNSTRIAEVLNFRRDLPPIATTAYVHALLGDPTKTDREIAELVRAGRIRKVELPGRGRDGEGLVRKEEWEGVVVGTNIKEEAKEKLLGLLHENPRATTLQSSAFTPDEATTLIHAGLLTHAHADILTPHSSLSESPNSLLSLARTAPSGTIAASGGSSAIHTAGGNIGTRRPYDGEYRLALPNTGPYLRLLTDARSHFLDLLKKSSPKYREAPLSAVREKWDGGVFAEAGLRRRGELGVLPGRTRKWREFCGGSFEWVVGECVGSGLVELFETGTVGLGVRGMGRRA